MKRAVWIVFGVVFLMALLSGCFWWGMQHAERTMSVRRVDPATLAAAMQGDHFYSDYKQNTLVAGGTIASVARQDGKLVATYKTSGSFKAQCELSGNATSIKTGQNVKLLTEGGAAERLPHAVLLHDCVLP